MPSFEGDLNANVIAYSPTIIFLAANFVVFNLSSNFCIGAFVTLGASGTSSSKHVGPASLTELKPESTSLSLLTTIWSLVYYLFSTLITGSISTLTILFSDSLKLISSSASHKLSPLSSSEETPSFTFLNTLIFGLAQLS